MPSDGDASASNKSKTKENFYLSEGKKNKKKEVGRRAFFLLLLQERRYFKKALKFRHRSGLG
jgi:hypothetical protein